MLSYSVKATKILKENKNSISSFLSPQENNIDWKTVHSFGKEWQRFDSFNEEEVKRIGNDYFDLVDHTMVNRQTVALDVGCGSGRWARYLADQVNFIEAIDPSLAVFSASKFLKDKTNIRISHAGVDNIPFENESFDFIYSLGVLHHLPDTSHAIGKCKDKLKSKGWFLLYLYYALDNRGFLYTLLFHVSTFFRKIISRLPQGAKQFVCDLIAVTFYLPSALISRGLYSIALFRKFVDRLPLSYYRKTSFHVMRNDALDRFGTPLEKRFSREEIETMLKQNGFVNIRFSNNPPYWHVVAQRP